MKKFTLEGASLMPPLGGRHFPLADGVCLLPGVGLLGYVLPGLALLDPVTPDDVDLCRVRIPAWRYQIS